MMMNDPYQVWLNPPTGSGDDNENVPFPFGPISQTLLPSIKPGSHFCVYHGNALFATAKICILHINIFRWTSVPNFIKIDQNLWEEFATEDLYPFSEEKCLYMNVFVHLLGTTFTNSSKTNPNLMANKWNFFKFLVWLHCSFYSCYHEKIMAKKVCWLCVCYVKDVFINFSVNKWFTKSMFALLDQRKEYDWHRKLSRTLYQWNRLWGFTQQGELIRSWTSGNEQQSC